MANDSIQNPHAKREGMLASLIAQETLQDIYGGKEKTYNGPGLLIGCVTVLVALGTLALMGAGALYLLGG